MILKLLVACVLASLPLHDFHTSLMNITYQADKKSFEIDLTVDTEHFEESLMNEYNTYIGLGELDENDSANSYIQTYINDQIQLKLNRKTVAFQLVVKQVTFAETTLHFEAVCFRQKLKQIRMHNTLMINDFPKTKNLVKIFYKERSESMLFDKNTDLASIKL